MYVNKCVSDVHGSKSLNIFTVAVCGPGLPVPSRLLRLCIGGHCLLRWREVAMERRIDPTDGMAYTREEFFEYYCASFPRAYWANNMALYWHCLHAVNSHWDSCALAPPEHLHFEAAGPAVQTRATPEHVASEVLSALADRILLCGRACLRRQMCESKAGHLE